MNVAPGRLDRRAVARFFNRASDQYAAAAVRQGRIGAELLERLQFFRLEPRVILDLGCGTGAGATALRARFPRAQLIALDLALDMVRQARRRQRWWRRFGCVCADACALPLAAQSVDLVFSNLMLQWCDDAAALFTEVQRVLRPGGLLLFSTFGPDTLRELRGAWASADPLAHVGEFADMPRLGAAMAHAGLAEPVMDRELELAHYVDAQALMQELRAIGARHAAADRRRTLTGRGRLRAMLAAYESLRTSAGLPASWEVIYGAAFAGHRAAAAASGHASGPARESAVPLSAIGSRPRNP